MARISFSALVESITGKLAGSVFQDSYQGFQIRTRVSPRNPQTNYQQLRRGEFAFLQQGWRYLSDSDRATWSDNAPAGVSAINFYLSSNINLTLIDLAPVAAYETAAVPNAFEIDIIDLGDGIFTIKASGAITVVPVDTSLLIQATAEKAPTKIFTNPSQFSPINSFPAGTDLSSAIDIAAEWIARYGQFTSDKRICLKTNLISTINGARSEDFLICKTEITEMNYFIPLAVLPAPVTPPASTTTNFFTNTVPANTMQNAGDRLVFRVTAKKVAGTVNSAFTPSIAGLSPIVSNMGTGATIEFILTVTRIDASTASYCATQLDASNDIDLNQTTQSVDFTTDFSSNIQVINFGDGQIEVFQASLDLILAP